MSTTTGKTLFILTLVYASLLSGSIGLEITNTLGIPLTSIQVGAPFFVTVSLKEGYSSSKWPTVDSLDKLHIVGQRTEIKSSNDSSVLQEEKRMIYTVIADKPGVLTLGPAHQGNVSSPTQAVTIVEGRYPASSKASIPTYTLSIPSKNYVMGERVPFSLTFASQRAESKLTHLETLHGKNIKVENLNAGEAKVLVKNGELVSLIEYHGYFYPMAPGKVVIPPLRADYTLPLPNQSSFPKAFFLGAFAQTHAVYTQQKILTIDPLPATDLPLHAIGELTHYTAELDPSQAPRGEALMLRITVEGIANFDTLRLPELSAPEGIRMYESKSTVSKTLDGEKKEWEFVVQGVKEGTYSLVIPPLHYFDTTTRSYKKITTPALSFTITPGAPLPAEQKKEEKPTVETAKEETVEKTIPQSTSSEIEIPWTLFLVLLSIVPGVIIGRRLYLALEPRAQRSTHTLYRTWILFRASKAIQEAQRTNNASQLYDIMKQVMATYLHVPLDTTQEEMSRLLKNRGFSEKAQHEWSTLYNQLLLSSPYVPKKTTVPPSNVITMAQHWIQQLKKGPKHLYGFLLLCSIGTTLEASPSVEYEAFFQGLTHLSSYIPFIMWQLLVLCTWTGCWYYGALQYRRKAFFVSFFLFLTAAAGWALHARLRYYPPVYVHTEGAFLYLGPDNSYAIRRKLNADEKLTIAQKKDLWYYVVSSEGNGWVKAEDVTLEVRP